MTTNDPDELLRTRDVAKHFGVTSYTVREWIRERKISSIIVNGQHRIKRSELQRLQKEKYGV